MSAPEALGQLAAGRGLDLGAAVAPGPLRSESAYATTPAREFGMLTAENALKFGPLRPGRERWDFAGADTLWLRGLEPEYISTALGWAHWADPEARLFYNDYGAEGLNPKSDAVYRLARDLVDAELLQVCLECPACTALVLWGFADAHSWVPGFFEGFGAALIFDAQYRPKPAYRAMAEVLSRQAP